MLRWIKFTGKRGEKEGGGYGGKDLIYKGKEEGAAGGGKTGEERKKSKQIEEKWVGGRGRNG